MVKADSIIFGNDDWPRYLTLASMFHCLYTLEIEYAFSLSEMLFRVVVQDVTMSDFPPDQWRQFLEKSGGGNHKKKDDGKYCESQHASNVIGSGKNSDSHSVIRSGNQNSSNGGVLNSPLDSNTNDSDMNLLKENIGNVSVWVKFHGVPITTFSEDGLNVIATKLEWKYTIMVAMPKLVGEGFYMKIISDVVKNLKNPRQAIRGVQVGPKVGFKPTKQVYRRVSNKNSASTSGKIKQVGLFRQESDGKGSFTMALSSSSSTL
ncbi:hypothetical protein Tco_0167746 [Tanacetum coccineum]